MSNSTKELRECRVYFYSTSKEMQAINAAARRDGRTRSSWIRRAAVAALKKQR